MKKVKVTRQILAVRRKRIRTNEERIADADAANYFLFEELAFEIPAGPLFNFFRKAYYKESKKLKSQD